MFDDVLVKPSQWNALGKHDEDILCAAMMINQPMQMVTGGFDGEIVVWNSVTELASKHLTARKRSTKNLMVIRYDKINIIVYNVFYLLRQPLIVRKVIQ
jgi:hypothetical protein